MGSDAVGRAGVGGSGEIGFNVLVLVATLAAAAVAQGAFEGPSRWLVVGGLAVASIASIRRPVVATPPWKGATVAAGALAVWILVRAATSDAIVSGLWQAALVVGVCVTVFVVRRSSTVDRDAVLVAVVAIGAFVALTGWIGAAFRVEPWANPGPTTWRASSTLTYPNATAALVVAALLLVLARGRGAVLPRLDAVVGAVLFAGLLATQSRGGVIALVVGLGALVALAGVATVARAMVAPVVGGGLAFAISLQGFDAGRDAQPVLLLAALAVGVGVAAALTRLPQMVVAPLALAVVAVPLVAWSRGDRFTDVVGDRLQLGSADRVDAVRETVDLIQSNPIVGVGPGNVSLVWTSGQRLVSTQLVHNEYLQVTAELGVIGAVLLLVVLFMGSTMVRAARPDTPAPAWIGGTAALAALAAHSALDFLWHIPVVPLVAAAIFAAITSGVGSTSSSPSPSEPSDQHRLVSAQQGHRP